MFELALSVESTSSDAEYFSKALQLPFAPTEDCGLYFEAPQNSQSLGVNLQLVNVEFNIGTGRFSATSSVSEEELRELVNDHGFTPHTKEEEETVA